MMMITWWWWSRDDDHVMMIITCDDDDDDHVMMMMTTWWRWSRDDDDHVVITFLPMCFACLEYFAKIHIYHVCKDRDLLALQLVSRTPAVYNHCWTRCSKGVFHFPRNIKYITKYRNSHVTKMNQSPKRWIGMRIHVHTYPILSYLLTTSLKQTKKSICAVQPRCPRCEEILDRILVHILSKQAFTFLITNKQTNKKQANRQARSNLLIYTIWLFILRQKCKNFFVKSNTKYTIMNASDAMNFNTTDVVSLERKNREIFMEAYCFCNNVS